ncbi:MULTISPECIES: hypothetical protein [unclassified Gilliamella]|uniref:hypothetical protein n=1 Tax=unclassified Gilliamella TaxID=2685620 RepID=UPI001306FE86|nr:MULTISPECIES: hypothetical protein [unclassified Gilliamella]MWP50261.1 hypothetical protein [Gilliamella sp. Lep-s35]MWP69607.1 hypothetical protein [Gilliamella sp. Lep-s5]MWP77902.1 hypothetical protein [Gilliamella sp. Lep-s21]
MSLDKKIRENLDGKYLTIYSDSFKEGIEYASELKINQVQIILVSEKEVDFKEFEKVGDFLKIISFVSVVGNIKNLDSIYSLQRIEKLYFQQKQKFKIDISKFPKIEYLGSEYWKGLININKAHSLQGLLLLKYPNVNLNELSELKKLQRLHIYSSKIETLAGIEKLPLKDLSLARNNALENIGAIKELKKLKELLIEKCKKITDYTLIDSLKEKVDVRIIK